MGQPLIHCESKVCLGQVGSGQGPSLLILVCRKIVFKLHHFFFIDDLIADLVTIFAPLLTFGIFFVIVFIFCCITMFRPNNTMASSKTKYIDESESKMKRFNVETGEMDSLTMDKRSNSAG